MVIWFRAEQFPPLVSVPPIVTTGPSGSSHAAGQTELHIPYTSEHED